MFIRFTWLVALFLLGVMAFPQRGMAEETQHVQASLVSQYDAIVPYGETPIALKLDIAPGWHVYWQNPGDSGLAPQVTWQNLDEHLSLEIMPWPVPQKITTPPLASYGYETQVLIPFNLHLEQGEPGQEVQLNALAEWLVCKEICLPEKQLVTLTLPTAEVASEVVGVATLFKDTLKRIPLPGPSDITAETDGRFIDIILPVGTTEALFVPSQEGVIYDAGEQPLQQGRLRIPLDPAAAHDSTYLPGLLLTPFGNWQIEPALKAVTALPAFDAPLPSGDIWLAIVFALLGGLLLNLMPCVLPVLSLKVLGIAKQKSGKERKTYGQFYTLGVVASFLALGVTLLALRATGEGLGWGFQLQSPVFVAGLILLFTLLTLNLLGMFEILLPVSQRHEDSGHTSRSGAFMSGILAAVVASPCTVPFMGSAVAYALASGGVASLLVFMALGLGLALPFLLIAYIPHLAHFIPKPGSWMIWFKKLLALPLAATVAWLVWVYLQQIHFSFFWSFVALIGLGVAMAWLIRLSNNLLLPAGKRYGYLATALLLFATVLYGVQHIPLAKKVEYNQQVWQPFSEAKVRDLNSQGKDVFVAFTAAWCITCKANEYLVLHTTLTEEFFAKHNVVPLVADWTSRDAEIAAVLNKHGSQGVPFYLLYTRDGGIHTLPSLLTQNILEAQILKAQ